MKKVTMDGRKASIEAKEEVKVLVEELKKSGITPTLAVVLVGDDPASKVYAKQKEKACNKVGMDFKFYDLPGSSDEQDVLALLEKLNSDDSIHGILVEMPLPDHISNEVIQAAIDPSKDVDGSNPANLGRLVSGLDALKPCTPQGVMYLLDYYKIPLEGKKIAVVGRSNIVGKPVAFLLLERNATVTICHSRTKNASSILLESDIVVVATGRPEMITGDMIKEGAVVIDVGINSTEKGLVGDVHFDSVSEVASYVSPVPGGVGPLTTAMLLRNVVESAKRRVKNGIGCFN